MTTENIEDAIATDFRAGLTYKQMSERYGLPMSRVVRIVTKLFGRTPRLAIKHARNLAMIERIKSGMPLADAASECGITSDQAYRICAEYLDADTRRAIYYPQRHANADRDGAIRAAYESGTTQSELATIYGLSRARIHTIVNR